MIVMEKAAVSAAGDLLMNRTSSILELDLIKMALLSVDD